MRKSEDPLVANSRREAAIIAVIWCAATTYCCLYSYFFGYIRPGHPLGPADVRPIFGVPSWVFWGYMVPWAACGALTVWFAGFHMSEDDLGADHAPELEEEIRHGGAD